MDLSIQTNWSTRTMTSVPGIFAVEIMHDLADFVTKQAGEAGGRR